MLNAIITEFAAHPQIWMLMAVIAVALVCAVVSGTKTVSRLEDHIPSRD